MLEADPTIFEYEYDTDNKTASITSIHMLNSTATVVLPSYVNHNDENYVVNAIANRAFVKGNEQNVLLEYVYIASTIKTIGDEAFKGCTNLKGLYSFTTVDNIPTKISSDSFAIVEETIEMQAQLTLEALNVTALNKDEIVVPQFITIKKNVVTTNAIGDTYTQKYFYSCAPVLKENLFAGYSGTIYLYDNEANKEYANLNLEDKDVEFYTETKKFDISNFIYDEPEITEGAFVNKNQKVVLMAENNLIANASGNIIVPNSIIEANENEKISRSVIGFEEGAFDGIVNCKMVFLPNTFTKIPESLGNKAFKTIIYKINNDKLIAPTEEFSNKIVAIGQNAFQNCTALKNIDFSNATELAEIGMGAFENSALVSVDLSKTKLTIIDANTFKNCADLIAVLLPNTVVELGNSAFFECKKLESIGPTAQLNFVGTTCFFNCANFVPFESADIDYVADNAFEGCKIEE